MNLNADRSAVHAAPLDLNSLLKFAIFVGTTSCAGAAAPEPDAQAGTRLRQNLEYRCSVRDYTLDVQGC